MNPFPTNPVPRPRRLLQEWAVASQQVARRNAMIAATSLAQQRAETLEVEELLARLSAPHRPEETVAEGTASAAGG